MNFFLDMTIVNESEKKQIGVIVLWKGRYGFILTDTNESIFFRKKGLAKSYKEIKLLDEVEFKIAITEEGEHKDKPFAFDVKFVSNGLVSKYDRYAIIIDKWKKYNGIASSPVLESKISLFYTRLLKTNVRQLSKSDILFANVVKSRKNPDELFALFAYPLNAEHDIQFLSEQFQETGFKAIFQHLKIGNHSSLEKLKLGLGAIGKVDSSSKLEVLKGFLVEMKKEWNTILRWKDLEGTLEPSALLQFWKDDIIKDYDLSFLQKYFIATDANSKRKLLDKVESKSHRFDILNAYYELLSEKGYFQKLTKHLKTFLSVVIYFPPEFDPVVKLVKLN